MNPYVADLAVILVGMISGFLNTMASSGSAVSLPMLIFLGIPANVANGTNRVGLIAGSLSAIWTFHKRGALDWRRGLVLSVPVIFGTVLGAFLASEEKARAMGLFIVLAVIMALVLLFTKLKAILNQPAAPQPRLTPLNFALLFIVGIWAGFIVLDSATYVLLVLVLGVGYDLIRANAIKSLFLFFIGTISMLVFARQGEVDWAYGVLLAVGSIVGARIGARLASYERAKIWVFRLLVVVIVGEAIQLAFKYRLL